MELWQNTGKLIQISEVREHSGTLNTDDSVKKYTAINEASFSQT